MKKFGSSTQLQNLVKDSAKITACFLHAVRLKVSIRAGQSDDLTGFNPAPEMLKMRRNTSTSLCNISNGCKISQTKRFSHTSSQHSQKLPVQVCTESPVNKLPRHTHHENLKGGTKKKKMKSN